MSRFKADPRALDYLGRRLVAGLVDLGVMVGLQFALVRAINTLTPPTVPGHYFSLAGVVLLGTLGGLAWFTYAVLPLARTGSTLGKRWMGLCVISREGGLPTFSQAFWRESVGRWLSIMILYLGYLWPLFDRDRQALHDMVADTYVVSLKAKPRHTGGAMLGLQPQAVLGRWRKRTRK